MSEVLLDNGTILRQTYLGTEPPKEYIASEIDNKDLLKLGKGVDKDDGQSSTGDVKGQGSLRAEGQDEVKGQAEVKGQKIVDGELVTEDQEKMDESYDEDGNMKDKREQLKIDLAFKSKNGEKMIEKEGHEGKQEIDSSRVGSPYMLIKSPVGEEQLKDNDDWFNEQTDKQCDSNYATDDENSSSRPNSSTKVFTSLVIDIKRY